MPASENTKSAEKFYTSATVQNAEIRDFHLICKLAASVGQKNVNSCYVSI